MYDLAFSRTRRLMLLLQPCVGTSRIAVIYPEARPVVKTPMMLFSVVDIVSLLISWISRDVLHFLECPPWSNKYPSITRNSSRI